MSLPGLLWTGHMLLSGSNLAAEGTQPLRFWLQVRWAHLLTWCCVQGLAEGRTVQVRAHWGGILDAGLSAGAQTRSLLFSLDPRPSGASWGPLPITVALPVPAAWGAGELGLRIAWLWVRCSGSQAVGPHSAAAFGSWPPLISAGLQGGRS